MSRHLRVRERRAKVARERRDYVSTRRAVARTRCVGLSVPRAIHLHPAVHGAQHHTGQRGSAHAEHDGAVGTDVRASSIPRSVHAPLRHDVPPGVYAGVHRRRAEHLGRARDAGRAHECLRSV